MIFVFKFFDDIIFIRPSRAQDVDQPCKIHEQSMLKPKWGREGEMSDLQLDSKPMEKKKTKKKKTKEKQRKRKEKKKKERMLGLDSNEERWESEKCEWCNRALSNRGKNEFWKIDIAYSNSKSKIIKWYKT